MATQHFPLLSRPVGPLVAAHEVQLWQANPIRRRVLRMFLDEANELVRSGGVESDVYNGYARLLYLLRIQWDASWWLQWTKADATGPIITALIVKYEPIMAELPPNESELYESEQDLRKELRANPATRQLQWGLQQALY